MSVTQSQQQAAKPDSVNQSFADEVFFVRYPFVLEDYESFDGDGVVKTKSWRPGTRYEHVPPDDSELVADAEGIMVLTIISRHKPGKYPERIFYTRRWRDPRGNEFGKSRCLSAVAQKFNRLVRGYYHPYRLCDDRHPVTGKAEAAS